MKVACPFCGVPIQYHKPALPSDFRCPGCSKPFTLDTIARKKKDKEELLKRKLHELYIGSQRPCSSELSVFQAILSIALALDKTHFRYEWETAGCPTTLNEIKDTLSSIDYDPNITVIVPSSGKDKRQSTARLLYLLSENHSDAFEGHVSHLLQKDIVTLIVDQLIEEQDMKVVELLCYVLSYWYEHRTVQDIALNTLLSVINNHGEAIFTTFGSSYVEFLNKIIPEARETFSFIDLEFKSHQEAAEAMKSLIADKIKNA